MNLSGNETMAAEITRDPRWASLVSRDPGSNGKFFYSVRTTGVYCYPSCGARLPRPENVQFHSSPGDAEKAGFRPCKRCNPEQPPLIQQHAATIEKACRAIEASEGDLKLDRLAAGAGLSSFHFHRVFKAIAGVTPKKFAAATRSLRMRKELISGGSVTEAIYAAGYNSSSRFYATSSETLGMKPSVFQAGGMGANIRYATRECSLGLVLVAQSDVGICSILLGEDRETLRQDLEERFPRATLVRGGREFEELVAQVVRFVEEPRTGLELPLDIRGTVFQQRVWQALREVPAGSTASYTAIAERIGSPRSVRAVAQACGANALAVAIPCHRIVKNDGGLSGYRWGVERKRALLQREAKAAAKTPAAS